jgi:NAD(P)-dependent dehydrogenase (short-subunit alcohol dehydrogenase family)
MAKFFGRTVIVTGGASGIGRACVARLFDEGANVVAVDLDAQHVQAVIDDLGDDARLVGVGADISDAGQVADLVAMTVDRFGAVHGLVNCAGVRGVGTVIDVDRQVWDRNLAVNLTGAFNTTRAVASAIVDAGGAGAIVNVTSTAGVEGVPNRLAYVASKHGLVGLTRGAALDLGPLGIRVNAVAPGMIRTPMTSVMLDDPDQAERIRREHPIGRIGEPAEVAAAIAFLLSDDASFITGAIVPADGGSTAGTNSTGDQAGDVATG